MGKQLLTIKGACSAVGPPLQHNLSTTDKCTMVQHIYTQTITMILVRCMHELSNKSIGSIHLPWLLLVLIIAVELQQLIRW